MEEMHDYVGAAFAFKFNFKMEESQLFRISAIVFLSVTVIMLGCPDTASALIWQNISCDYPPQQPDIIENYLDLKMILQLTLPSNDNDPCIDQTDCDPYGIYICKSHKKWSKKCCAEYCGFCH